MPNQSDPTQTNPTPIVPDFQTQDTPPMPAENTLPISNIEPPVSDSDSGSSAPPDIPPIITSTPKKKSGGGKIIATILGLFLLVGGIGAGILLTQQEQDVREKAYTGTCSEEGAPSCAIAKQECTIEKADKCEWRLAPGSECGYKCVEIGGGGGGGFSCIGIKSYSSIWALLSEADLTKLKAGDIVNFCATGKTRQDIIPVEAARFTINGTLRPETTAKRPGGGKQEFCDAYTIPAGTTTFNVSAEVKVLNRWK